MPQPLADADLLARLVAFDSTSYHSNLPIANFLAEYLDRPGIRVDQVPSEDGEKVALVVRVGPAIGSERAGLTLSGHLDVVPAGGGWSVEPFALNDAGERWLGRGTADMKGFVALAANAAVRAAAGGELSAPLALVLTYDEEVGCLGAARLAERWPKDDPLPKNAVIGEPTSLRVVRMHKGHAKARVVLTGVSAHSGYPHLGRSAIEPAAAVIEALAELRRQLEAERPLHAELFTETPYVALNIGRIDGGTAINVVPERCVLEVGFRPLPGMESAPLFERLEEAVLAAAPEGSCEVEVLGEAPPLLLPAEAPICRALCELTGTAEAAAVSYATDASWLQYLGLDCAICGPGTIEVAHKPDEELHKSELEQGGRLVERLVERFCRAG